MPCIYRLNPLSEKAFQQLVRQEPFQDSIQLSMQCASNLESRCKR